MTGVWLLASVALARPVPFAEPYPHICGSICYGRSGGREVRLHRRDCAACLTEQRKESG